MSPDAQIIWQIIGLVCILVGAYFLWGWAAALFVFGLWSSLGTLVKNFY